MSTFLFKGKDPGGDFRSESISAENAQEAKARLREAGWTDLQLVMDEVCDVVRPHVEGPEAFKKVEISAEDQVRFFEGRGEGFWAQYVTALKRTLFESKGTLVLSLLLLTYGIYRHRIWLVVIVSLSLAVMLLVFPAAHWFFSLPSRCYARLNRAKVWGRWDEVLWCVARLRKIRRLTRIGPGELELVRCRAQAFAATGRLSEGLEEFRQFADTPEVPDWTYQSFLAGILDCAKDYEKALACRQKAVGLKPDSSALWIDLAYGLVRGLRRPVEAREALARAETLEINALGIPYAMFLRGLISWRERNYAQAKQHFQEAIPGLQKFAHAPLVEGLILLTKSYLCAVQGALGERTEAQRSFREVDTFLESARETELLEACRAPLRNA